MENRSQIKINDESFINAVDIMKNNMNEVVAYAEQVKDKQQRDDLFEGMSLSTRRAIENSEGPLDVFELSKLMKEISDKTPSKIKSLNGYTRDEVEEIKIELEKVEENIKEDARKRKEISDNLAKKIKTFYAYVTKKRLDTTQTQSAFDERKEEDSRELPEEEEGRRGNSEEEGRRRNSEEEGRRRNSEEEGRRRNSEEEDRRRNSEDRRRRRNSEEDRRRRRRNSEEANKDSDLVRVNVEVKSPRNY